MTPAQLARLAVLGLALALGWAAYRRWSRPVLIIDPGHGGGDPGAAWGEIREADLMLRAASELRAHWPAGAVYTRATRGELPSLEQRIRAADRGDISISLHVNAALASTANGAEVWANPAGMPYAEAIATAWQLAHGAGLDIPRWRRVAPADSWTDAAGRPGLWIGRVVKPCLLLELGFITHPMDRAFLLDPRRRGDALALVARALHTQFQTRAV